MSFEKHLETVINCNGIDAEIGLADYVIADYLLICLDALKMAIKVKAIHSEPELEINLG
jgi:hypothetical protein